MLSKKFFNILLLFLLFNGTYMTTTPFAERADMNVTRMTTTPFAEHADRNSIRMTTTPDDDYSAVEFNEFGEKNNGSFICQCGPLNRQVYRILNLNTAENILAILDETQGNLTKITEYYPPIAYYVVVCNCCEISFIKCYQNSSAEDGFSCIRKIAILSRPSYDTAIFYSTAFPSSDINKSKMIVKRKTEYFPKILDIPIGGFPKHERQIRQEKICEIPEGLETNAIHCIFYPSSVKCIQRCIFGYTLDMGIEQDIRCYFKENIWRPYGFKECLPYLKCIPELVSPGFLKCTTASLTYGPTCSAQCSHAGGLSAVPLSGPYRCKSDGSWEPPLPFCVGVATNYLVPMPENTTLHQD